MTDLERFKIFCAQFLTTENGRPLVVEPFQERILLDFFAGCRETVVIVGKKNGKSSLLGAVALFHLLTTSEAEVVIVAASRDQAQIILRQIQGFVRRSKALKGRLQTIEHQVRHEASGGRIRVLASDSDTLDGQLPTLALVDELARTKTEEAYGLLRDGLGPRKGQLIAISTAGTMRSLRWAGCGRRRTRCWGLRTTGRTSTSAAAGSPGTSGPWTPGTT